MSMEPAGTAARSPPSPVVISPSTTPLRVNQVPSSVSSAQTIPTNAPSLHTATPAVSTPAPKALMPSPVPAQTNSSSHLLPTSTPWANVVSIPEPTASATATASPSSEANHRVSPEAIAGAVIGSCLFLTLVIGLASYLMKRKARNSSGALGARSRDTFLFMAQKSSFLANPRNQEGGGIGASPVPKMSRASSISSAFSVSSNWRSEKKLPARAPSAPSVREEISFHNNPHAIYGHGAIVPDAEYIDFSDLHSDFRGWDGSRPHLPDDRR